MILDLEKCYGAWWWRKDKKRVSVIMVARLDNLRTTSKIKTRYLIWRFEKEKNQPAGIPPRS